MLEKIVITPLDLKEVSSKTNPTNSKWSNHHNLQPLLNLKYQWDNKSTSIRDITGTMLKKEQSAHLTCQKNQHKYSEKA